MNKFLTLLIFAFLTSCSTIQDNFNLSKVPQTINAVVPTMVEIGVNKQPKARPYLRSLVIVIDTFALGQELTPAALEQTIKTAKIKELETPEALGVARSVVALYKAYYDAAVTQKIADTKNLAPILSALSSSITKGLYTPVTSGK